MVVLSEVFIEVVVAPAAERQRQFEGCRLELIPTL
jgi:hypothetical protein